MIDKRKTTATARSKYNGGTGTTTTTPMLVVADQLQPPDNNVIFSLVITSQFLTLQQVGRFAFCTSKALQESLLSTDEKKFLFYKT